MADSSDGDQGDAASLRTAASPPPNSYSDAERARRSGETLRQSVSRQEHDGSRRRSRSPGPRTIDLSGSNSYRSRSPSRQESSMSSHAGGGSPLAASTRTRNGGDRTSPARGDGRSGHQEQSHTREPQSTFVEKADDFEYESDREYDFRPTHVSLFEKTMAELREQLKVNRGEADRAEPQLQEAKIILEECGRSVTGAIERAKRAELQVAEAKWSGDIETRHPTSGTQAKFYRPLLERAEDLLQIQEHISPQHAAAQRRALEALRENLDAASARCERAHQAGFSFNNSFSRSVCILNMCRDVEEAAEARLSDDWSVRLEALRAESLALKVEQATLVDSLDCFRAAWQSREADVQEAESEAQRLSGDSETHDVNHPVRNDRLQIHFNRQHLNARLGKSRFLHSLPRLVETERGMWNRDVENWLLRKAVLHTRAKALTTLEADLVESETILDGRFQDWYLRELQRKARQRQFTEDMNDMLCKFPDVREVKSFVKEGRPSRPTPLSG